MLFPESLFVGLGMSIAAAGLEKRALLCRKGGVAIIFCSFLACCWDIIWFYGLGRVWVVQMFSRLYMVIFRSCFQWASHLKAVLLMSIIDVCFETLWGDMEREVTLIFRHTDVLHGFTVQCQPLCFFGSSS